MKTLSFTYPIYLWVYSLRETPLGWTVMLAGRSPRGHVVVQAGTAATAQAAADEAALALTKYLDDQPSSVTVKAIDLDLSDI